MPRAAALVVAALALTLVSLAAVEAGPGKGRGGNTNEARVEGAVTAVTANSVTITTVGGRSVTVGVTAATKVERNGFRVPLSAFRIGDRGQARFNAVTFVASKVEAVGP
jgi:hypothetical protein